MRFIGFDNRTTAGIALAKELKALNIADPIVLALPRGGVPVALEVARVFKAPLDLVLVRKVGVPFQPELAAGAVVDGDNPEIIYNDDVIRITGLHRADLQQIAERELKEIERRRELYLKDRARLAVKGRNVIVVDDGLATGATMRVALHALRRQSPSRLIAAVPVAPRDTIESLRGDADEIVCLAQPEPFVAIGLYYANFEQLKDEDVVRLLAEADDIASDSSGD